MASDTYYKDVWLRRNKAALQVVIVLLGLICLILIIKSTTRRGSEGGGDSNTYVNGAGFQQQIPPDKAPPSKTGYIRGRVFNHDDDFDPDLDDDDKNPDRVADCCTIYDLWQTSKDDFECTPMSGINLREEPVICFYPDQADNDKNSDTDLDTVNFILKQLQEGGESYGFIDIGTGLGTYSIAAASLGRSVLAVEQSVDNVKRFHKAAKLGRLESSITLLNNAVSDVRGYVTVVRGQPEVKQIMLNDLPAFCKFRKALMKLFLNGNEHKAFRHAMYLFRELQITFVFFEWEYLKDKTDDEDIGLIDEMIKYFNKRGYVPRSYAGKVLSIKKWQQWPNKIYWQKM